MQLNLHIGFVNLISIWTLLEVFYALNFSKRYSWNQVGSNIYFTLISMSIHFDNRWCRNNFMILYCKIRLSTFLCTSCHTSINNENNKNIWHRLRFFIIWHWQNLLAKLIQHYYVMYLIRPKQTYGEKMSFPYFMMLS